MRLAPTFSRFSAPPPVATPAAQPASLASPALAARVKAPLRAEHTDPAPRLLAAWAKPGAYKAPVSDAELGQGVQTMFTYLHDKGFFRDRLDGIERKAHLGPNGDLDFLLVPNRMRHKPTGNGAHVCPFDSQPDPIERGLLWRDYQVLANAFPYAPKESQHTVIATEAHVPQGFSASMLGDMIDYQRLQPKPVSMHFNGIAGNSQRHFHWHAQGEVWPLQKKLDAGRLETTPLRRTAQGTVSTYEEDFFRGFLVEGTRNFVTRQAARIVREMEKDPTIAGHYNMLLLQPRAGQIRLAVVPRLALSDGAKHQIGALGVAGRGVLVKDHLPEDAVANMIARVDATVPRPSTLPWVAALKAAPESDAISLRAWMPAGETV